MNKSAVYRIKAEADQIYIGLDPISEVLEQLEVDHKICYKVRLALDELLANVVSYAYDTPDGYVEIRYQIDDEPRSITITIIDEGKPFNPLEEIPEPDITSSIAQRKIGGLGMFIVKNIMDEIEYTRDGNKNVLVIKKNI